MCRNGRYTEHGIKGLHGFARERWRAQPDALIRLDPASPRSACCWSRPPSWPRRGSRSSGSAAGRSSAAEGRRDHRRRAGRAARRAAGRAARPGGARLRPGDRAVRSPQLVADLGAHLPPESLPDSGLEPDVRRSSAPACRSVVVDVMTHNATDGDRLPDRRLVGRRLAAARHRRAEPQGRAATTTSCSAPSTPTAATTRRAPPRWRAADQAWLSRLITRRVTAVEDFADAFARRPDDVKVVLEFEEPDEQRDRGLRAHRRPAHRRAGRPGRLDRLAVPAQLRLPRLLRRAAGHAEGRPLAARPGGRRYAAPGAATAATRWCWRPSGDTPTAASGSSTSCRRAARASTWCASSRAVSGAVRHAHGAGAALRLRPGRAVGAPARRRARGDRRAGRRLAAHAGATARGRSKTTVADFTVRAGDRVPFVLTWSPSHRGAPAAARRRELPGARRSTYWQTWSDAVHVHGRYRDGDPALPADAQGADVSSRPAASWPRSPPRCRSRSAARATGTTATAGCATRRTRCRRCSPPATSRRPRRGGTGCCARSPATRASCRSCTASTAPAGCPSSSCRGSPGYEGSRAGTGRQRRRRPAAARRVGRGARQPLPGPAGRPGLDDDAWDLQVALLDLPRGRLAAAGQRAVGDARPAPALHPLQGDGVGRVRPDGAQRCASRRSARRRRPLGGDAATRSTPRSAPRLRRRQEQLRAVLRLRRAGRQRCC